MGKKHGERAVLVVTPDRDLRELLELALAMGGYGVIGAATGRDAVSRALAHVPDLLLLERDLPDLRAGEVTKNLQAFERTRDIPVIYLVRATSDIETLSSFRADRDQFLQKPFSLLALSRALSRILEPVPS